MACFFDKGERDSRMSIHSRQLLEISCGISMSKELQNKHSGFYALCKFPEKDL
jgi:hypothetical protein